MKHQKVLLTGHTGMLGQALVDELLKNRDLEVMGVSRQYKPGCSYKQVKCDFYDSNLINTVLEEVKPDIIVHVAGLVNLKSCEDDPQWADAIHVDATNILSSYQPKKTRFIYISTDSVFDGKKGGYSENEVPIPLNYYSKSKLEGEKVALNNNPNTLILRTNIYGVNSSTGHSLVEWAIKELRQGHEITGFSDVFFNPLSTGQCASVIHYFMNDTYCGILHLGSDEVMSKYDFLCQLANVFEFDLNLIRKGDSLQVSLYPDRPLNTSLDVSNLRRLFNEDLRLKEGLVEVKNAYI